MKSSEVITLLQQHIDKHGDADVTVQTFNEEENSYSFEPVIGIFRFHESKEVVTSFCLCDQETMDGLQENAEPELEDDEGYF